MKLTRFVPVLFLAVAASACGRDSLVLPEASPPPEPVLQLSPAGGEAVPANPNFSTSSTCEGDWVVQTNPDGSTTLVCVGPHQGTGD